MAASQMAASAPLTPAAYRQIVDKFGNVAIK